MREENAYLTVEAALVFPLVLGSLLFVIYTMLFQYDRCLLEQDLGALALWGSVAEAKDTAELERMVQERTAALYKEKYAAWKFTDISAELGKNRFSAKGAGQLTFPFAGLNFWGGGNVWSAGCEYEYSRLSPVSFIRICNKALKAMER